MPAELCSPLGFTALAFECFALDKSAPKFFGFAELISGLALTLVVWTVADIRYKFRIDTAFLPIRRLSVVITIIVGFLALMTDYWRAQQLRVPVGDWLTPESWQALLAAAFFFVLALWLWRAFFSPVKFNAINAKKFAIAVEKRLLRGSATELAIVGDELAKSAKRIVKHAVDDSFPDKVSKTSARATWLLMAMASPKFCTAVVEGSPRLIVSVFNAVRDQRKHSAEISIFAKNIVAAAIENRNSFLYHEQDYYESGLEGLTRPVTTALCGNPWLVRHIDDLLNPAYSKDRPWDLEQWKAYFRLVLAAFTSHVGGGAASSKPHSLHLAFRKIGSFYADLRHDLQLDDLKYGDDLDARLREVAKVINSMVAILDQQRDAGKRRVEHALQDIAELIFSLIKAASSVRKPRRVSRKIQHTLIWQEILNSAELRTPTGLTIHALVQAKLMASIRSIPNLDSARLLGYSLNVLGFEPPKPDDPYGSPWRNFHIDCIDWVQRNIARLLTQHRRLASECFVEGMSFDNQHNRLVICYPADEFGEVTPDYLDVDPAPEPKPQGNPA
ncbi:MAG: hypothetical protein ACLGJA_01510 [Gammaproteobacteria bacterium]